MTQQADGSEVFVAKAATVLLDGSFLGRVRFAAWGIPGLGNAGIGGLGPKIKKLQQLHVVYVAHSWTHG